ncbi:MAG: hypothetical protein DLM61_19485 [Pseudonocardiales bacterium]|nr:MAG: hypothetical protein DLM61_19485 [Pseudonocardiales bacterium]
MPEPRRAAATGTLDKSAVRRSAVLSDDGRYRYLLTRVWGYGPRVLFVMLNPSTADASIDDATIRACMALARRWGYAGITVINLYAWRATDPTDLDRVPADRATGADNDEHINRAVAAADLIVAAWGASLPRAGAARAQHVLSLLRAAGLVHHLGLTKHGHPRHPVRLRTDTTPHRWPAQDATNHLTQETQMSTSQNPDRVVSCGPTHEWTEWSDHGLTTGELTTELRWCVHCGDVQGRSSAVPAGTGR